MEKGLLRPTCSWEYRSSPPTILGELDTSGYCMMEEALPRWPSLPGMPSDSEMFRFSLDAGDVTRVLDTQSGERVESWRGPACWHLRLFFQGMLHKIQDFGIVFGYLRGLARIFAEASNLTCRFWDWSNFQSSVWVILGWPQEDGVMLVLVKCESWAMW